MREIKFRAWDKIDKKMRTVTRMTFGLPATGHPLLIVYLDDGTEDPVSRSADDVVLLQYSGLKAKDGEKIYEGDIVEWTIFPDKQKPKRVRDVVGFGAGCFRVEKRLEILGLKEPHRQIKKIGNIYENPELIEK